MKSDLTVEILKQIRDEVKQVRDEVKQTNVRLDQVNGSLEQTRVELGARIDETNARLVESEIRTATAITALAGSVQEMTAVLRQGHDLRPRVERCESEIAAIKAKLPAA